MIRRTSARCTGSHYVYTGVVRNGEREAIGVWGCPDSGAEYRIMDPETDAPHTVVTELTERESNDVYYLLCVAHHDDIDAGKTAPRAPRKAPIAEPAPPASADSTPARAIGEAGTSPNDPPPAKYACTAGHAHRSMCGGTCAPREDDFVGGGRGRAVRRRSA